MKMKQAPLALALALAIGALASGCARDSQPATDADTAAAAADVDAHADANEHAEADAHGDDEDHAAAIAQAAGNDFPVPANHVPWTPDAPLIEGMSRVRTAVGALESHPDADTVRARAADVDAAVEYMFANCNLGTEPDIALHAILARLTAGTQALNANPADAAPVIDMHAAVQNYERLFDDPNEGDGDASAG